MSFTIPAATALIEGPLSAVQSTTPTVRKTALNAVHRQMGAKMVDFNGWDMPVEYPSAGGIIAEHNAVRTGVGIFDVSHMGDIRLQGRGALAAVQHISMNDASRLAVGQAQYSALLYPEGTFVDDVIVHRLGEAVDDDVVHKRAFGIKHGRILSLTDGQARSIIHRDVLHGCERLRPSQADVAHVADIENAHAGAYGHVFVDDSATN